MTRRAAQGKLRRGREERLEISGTKLLQISNYCSVHYNTENLENLRPGGEGARGRRDENVKGPGVTHN